MAVNSNNYSTYFSGNSNYTRGQSNYSQAEIMRMRQDAIRRTNELHSRSRNPKDTTQHNTQYRNAPPVGSNPAKPPPITSENNSANSNSKPPSKGIISDLLGGLGLGDILNEISGETAIILILIVLLVRDKADMKLVLALCYLLI